MPIPDENLHPVATGKAAAIVEAHEKVEADHVLYSGWFCPFVQRVWITLEEKKIPYRYQEINPYRKDPSFLRLNPRGLVPTLGVTIPSGQGDKEEQQEQALIESGIICEYLDETFPQSPALLPHDDPLQRAKLRIAVDYVTSRIIPAFHRFLQHTPDQAGGGGGGGPSLDEVRAEFLQTLRTWIQDAHPEGPFYAGAHLTLPDVILAPWAVRLWVFDHFKEGGLGVPSPGQARGNNNGGSGEGVEEEEDKEERAWARWRKWVAAVEGRASVQATLSDKEYYLPIYERYHTNTAQSELAKATRAGRGVP